MISDIVFKFSVSQCYAHCNATASPHNRHMIRDTLGHRICESIIIPSDRRSEDSREKLIRSDRRSEAVFYIYYVHIVTETTTHYLRIAQCTMHL